LINKKSLGEQIHEELKKDIFEQKIRFGEKLVNRDLQQRYGVSSTPIRDAINYLYMDGLLQSVSQGGARVIDFDNAYALEINELIAMMNCSAIALSVKKGEKDIIVKELEIAIRKQEEFLNTDRYFDYDHQFHKVFFTNSKNQSLIKLYDQYSSLWQLLFRFYYRDKATRREYSIAAHKQILNLYRESKVEQVIQEMKQHFEQATQTLEKAPGGAANEPLPGKTNG